MRIRRVSFFRAVSPHSQPIADATHQIPEIALLVTRIECDDGTTGESYLLSFHYSPHAIRGALADVAAMAVGWKADDPGGFIAHCERESEYFGNAGVNRWAAGAFDIAMWDALGRSRGLPVWRMFDVRRERIPLYGSGGWLSYSIEELVDEAERYVGRGFRAVKVKVGSSSRELDVERLTKVREAVGSTVGIMMDANQGLSRESAFALATALEPLRIEWFEEPLNHTDFDGYRELKKTAGMSLAMGEREYDTVALRELISRGAIDLWQPDILRLGGVESWLESAALAGRHGVGVLPHYYKEYDVPLLMTIPNGRGAESFDWVDPLIDHPIRMEGGFAYPSEKPGWGFRFLDEHLKPI